MLNWRETGRDEYEAQGTKGLIFKVRFGENHRGADQYELIVKNPRGFFDVRSFFYSTWKAAKEGAERLDKGLKA